MFQQTQPTACPDLDLATRWDEAEAAFPECSAAWDRDGGPAWVAGRDHLTIVVTQSGVMVGCDVQEPFGWALWIPPNDQHTGHWLFL